MRYRPGFCGINLALMCGANDVALTTETSQRERECGGNVVKSEREKGRDNRRADARWKREETWGERRREEKRDSVVAFIRNPSVSLSATLVYRIRAEEGTRRTERTAEEESGEKERERGGGEELGDRVRRRGWKSEGAAIDHAGGSAPSKNIHKTQ